MTAEHVGIDFGTTNSALAVVRPGAGPELVSYQRQGAKSQTGRSVLFFDPLRRDARMTLQPWAGPPAIDAYLLAAEDETPGRLMQSLKSHLASRSFTKTNVFGTSYDLSDLIRFIVAGLADAGRSQLGVLARKAVVGRPVKFAAADTEDDDRLATDRLRAAFQRAGFEDIVFEYEPVAAAHFYDSTLDHDELVLIADFGGGTSDFSLMRVGPTARKGPSAERILGNSGVALAGDAFDRRIVERVVAPRLGQGSHYRAAMGTNRMPVPGWIFHRMRAWHHLSFLKSPDAMSSLRDVLVGAEDPAAIASLIHLVENDLGYALYAVVERVKAALSRQDRVMFEFHDDPIAIRTEITRADFETWIAPELAAISGSVDGLLAATGVAPSDVDAVFLTGGTAFVPAVRRWFAGRFGDDRLRGGNEMTSVALGLALRAQELGL
jgi:hypothetical chaperone protein